MCPRRLRDVPPPQFSPILTSKPRQTATARQASCRAHLTGSIAHQGNVVGAPKLLITVPPGLGRESGLCQGRWEFQYPAPQKSLLAEAREGCRASLPAVSLFRAGNSAHTVPFRYTSNTALYPHEQRALTASVVPPVCIPIRARREGSARWSWTRLRS